jgi:hypothetical protein
MTLGKMVHSSLTLSKKHSKNSKTQQYSPNDPMQNDFQQNNTSIMTLRGIINMLTVTWLSVALLNVVAAFNYLRKTFLDRKRNIVVPRL